MDRDKIAGIALAVINIILLVFCTVRYVQSDRTPPRFLLEATDIIYAPGMDNAELAQGITANDDRDGDVTGRIVVEKVTEKKKEQTAVVYYAVSDKAGNVAKLSKLFHAEYPEEETQPLKDGGSIQDGEVGGQDRPGRTGTGNGTDTETDGADKQEEGIGAQPDTGEPEGDVGARPGEERPEEDTGSQPEGEGPEGDTGAQPGEDEPEGDTETQPEADEPEGDTETQPEADEPGGDTETQPETEETEEGRNQTAVPEDTPQPGQQETVPVGTGAPELVLGSSEITINAGTNPPWTEIITTMRDDKDDYAALYYSLHVSQFNRNRPGTYPVTVYVEDSDGNRSQEVPFTIIVRE